MGDIGKLLDASITGVDMPAKWSNAESCLEMSE